MLLFQLALGSIDRRCPREIQDIDAVLPLSALAKDRQSWPGPVPAQQLQTHSLEVVVVGRYPESLGDRHSCKGKDCQSCHKDLNI